jgi:hypothetical protein
MQIFLYEVLQSKACYPSHFDYNVDPKTCYDVTWPNDTLR